MKEHSQQSDYEVTGIVDASKSQNDESNLECRSAGLLSEATTGIRSSLVNRCPKRITLAVLERPIDLLLDLFCVDSGRSEGFGHCCGVGFLEFVSKSCFFLARSCKASWAFWTASVACLAILSAMSKRWPGLLKAKNCSLMWLMCWVPNWFAGGVALQVWQRGLQTFQFCFDIWFAPFAIWVRFVVHWPMFFVAACCCCLCTASAPLKVVDLSMTWGVTNVPPHKQREGKPKVPPAIKTRMTPRIAGRNSRAPSKRSQRPAAKTRYSAPLVGRAILLSNHACHVCGSKRAWLLEPEQRKCPAARRKNGQRWLPTLASANPKNLLGLFFTPTQFFILEVKSIFRGYFWRSNKL